jgi:adenosylhomocysteine nucleosidase
MGDRFACYIIDMILVLTPLALENDSLRAHLGEVVSVSDSCGVKIHRFAGDLACANGGHGKVQFALTTQMLIRELSPRLVICAGACGALSPQVQLLDVIAAVDTVEHDFNLRFIERPLPRFAGDRASLACLRELGTTPGFSLHFGTIASGDEDIVDSGRVEAVRTLTEGLAVAWEGAGGARAAAFCKTPYLELRVVTDVANASASQDFRRNVQAGMKHIALVLKKLV